MDSVEVATVRARVVSAFASLRRRKKDPVMTRVSAADCHACSLSILRGSCKEAQAFAYWTGNDDYLLRRGNNLRIRFGMFDCTREQARKIGEDVVEALGAAGVSTEWTGDPSRVIYAVGTRDPVAKKKSKKDVAESIEAECAKFEGDDE